MVLFIIFVFILAFAMGMCYGVYFLKSMYNSDKQKDRDWAINLLNRKNNGTL